jgi:hypothetical protein
MQHLVHVADVFAGAGLAERVVDWRVLGQVTGNTVTTSRTAGEISR